MYLIEDLVGHWCLILNNGCYKVNIIKEGDQRGGTKMKITFVIIKFEELIGIATIFDE